MRRQISARKFSLVITIVTLVGLLAAILLRWGAHGVRFPESIFGERNVSVFQFENPEAGFKEVIIIRRDGSFEQTILTGGKTFKVQGRWEPVDARSKIYFEPFLVAIDSEDGQQLIPPARYSGGDGYFIKANIDDKDRIELTPWPGQHYVIREHEATEENNETDAKSH